MGLRVRESGANLGSQQWREQDKKLGLGYWFDHLLSMGLGKLCI